MKKTLYIYILREQLIPVIICLTGICFLLITGQLLQLLRILFASSCSMKDLGEIVLFALPKLISYATPMAALLGVMLAFIRLNGDNELIAFRAAGISFLGFLPPVLGVLVVATTLSFINAIFVIPVTNHAFQAKLRSLGRNSVPALLKEGVFVSAIPNLVFFFRSVDHSDLSIKGVFIQDQRQPKEKATIAGESAQVFIPPDSNSITFRIANGGITRTSQDLKEAQSVAFKNYDFLLSMDEIMGSADKAGRKRSEMSLAEIYEQVKTAPDRKNYVWWSLELHQRIAFPAACLLLGLLGPPLGSLFRQKGRMTGITLGIIIFLVYYILLSAGHGLGENNILPPFLAIWTPNLLSLALAVYLWAKMHRETPFKIVHLGWQITRLARIGFDALTDGMAAR
ncbi:MAG: LptF/LptG family permease [Syntrophobacteraceae bacterium]